MAAAAAALLQYQGPPRSAAASASPGPTDRPTDRPTSQNQPTKQRHMISPTVAGCNSDWASNDPFIPSLQLLHIFLTLYITPSSSLLSSFSSPFPCNSAVLSLKSPLTRPLFTSSFLLKSNHGTPSALVVDGSLETKTSNMHNENDGEQGCVKDGQTSRFPVIPPGQACVGC